MVKRIKALWLSISEKNRKRIVSSTNTFVWTAVTVIGVKFADGDPITWGLLALAARQATRETLDYLLVRE